MPVEPQYKDENCEPPIPFPNGIGVGDINGVLRVHPWLNTPLKNLFKKAIEVRSEYRNSYLVPSSTGSASPARKEWLQYIKSLSYTHTVPHPRRLLTVHGTRSLQHSLTVLLVWCAVSTGLVQHDDGGAVFALTPKQLHQGWWIKWIAESQEWVKAQMKKDRDKLHDLAMAVMKKTHPEYEKEEDFTVLEEWLEEATDVVREEDPSVPVERFEQLPPALLVIHDIRARIREERNSARRPLSRAAEAEEDGEDGGKRRASPQVTAATKKKKPSPRKRRDKPSKQADEEDDVDDAFVDTTKQRSTSTKRGRTSKTAGPVPPSTHSQHPILSESGDLRSACGVHAHLIHSACCAAIVSTDRGTRRRQPSPDRHSHSSDDSDDEEWRNQSESDDDLSMLEARTKGAERAAAKRAAAAASRKKRRDHESSSSEECLIPDQRDAQLDSDMEHLRERRQSLLTKKALNPHPHPSGDDVEMVLPSSLDSTSGEREFVGSQEARQQQGEVATYNTHTASMMSGACCLHAACAASLLPLAVYLLRPVRSTAKKAHFEKMEELMVDELVSEYRAEHERWGEDARIVHIVAFISGFSNNLARLGVDVLRGQSQLDNWVAEIKKTRIDATGQKSTAKKATGEVEDLWTSQQRILLASAPRPSRSNPRPPLLSVCGCPPPTLRPPPPPLNPQSFSSSL